MFKTSTIIAALAMASTVAPMTASAQATAMLTWNDLDLSTEAGQTQLERRIQAAANQACRGEQLTGSKIRQSPDARCVADARAQIRAKLPKHALMASRGGSTDAR